jgi:hypothetical protein
MPSLNRELAKEIIHQGHLQGLKVLAHISTHRAAQDMIEDGIDGLVHIFADKLISDELLDLTKRSEVFIIPTLAVIGSADNINHGPGLVDDKNIGPFLSPQQRATLSANYGAHIPGFEYDIAKRNIKQVVDAGIPILSGSDAPNPGTAYGISALHETALLVEAGMSPSQALAAATSEPARIFGVNGRGRIEVGSRADLLLLKGNPLDDIRALYNIDAVYKNGFSVSRELVLSSLVGENPDSSILGDFSLSSNKGMDTIEGFMWSLSADSMANGKSLASIKVVPSPSHNSNKGVLKVNATVNAGFPYPWSGAVVGDFVAPITGKDMSGFTHIVFDVKGTPGNYRVMGFDTTNAGVPPNYVFSISEKWQTIKVPLLALKGLNTKLVSGFAFVAGPELGNFEFYLDNVSLQ